MYKCDDQGDNRLHHIAIYIMLNEEKTEKSDPLVMLSITEQFIIPELDNIPKYV